MCHSTRDLYEEAHGKNNDPQAIKNKDKTE